MYPTDFVATVARDRASALRRSAARRRRGRVGRPRLPAAAVSGTGTDVDVIVTVDGLVTREGARRVECAPISCMR